MTSCEQFHHMTRIYWWGQELRRRCVCESTRIAMSGVNCWATPRTYSSPRSWCRLAEMGFWVVECAPMRFMQRRTPGTATVVKPQPQPLLCQLSSSFNGAKTVPRLNNSLRPPQRAGVPRFEAYRRHRSLRRWRRTCCRWLYRLPRRLLHPAAGGLCFHWSNQEHTPGKRDDGSDKVCSVAKTLERVQSHRCC